MLFKNKVDRFISEASESSMNALVQHAQTPDVTDEDIAYLAKSCANASGLIWNNLNNSADVASTGGPTSLTTLVCPLYLRALGYQVPKLGVPGRPAGGIDVLAQVPGFKFNLTDSQAVAALNRAGYVHFLADDSHGRHDAILFSYRKRNNALAVPPLVIASLLTKKLIVGLSRVGLDVRVSSFGNFGTTWAHAKDNAKRFCNVARLLGVSAVCFLTDATVPYQPYIGRGESLAALGTIIDGTTPTRLSHHLDLCYAIARRASDVDCPRPTARDLRVHFEENLKAQEASIDGFFEKVSNVTANHKFELTAREDGFFDIDIEKTRRILVSAQDALMSESDPFPDPVGMILKYSSGAYIRRGDVIATFRASDSNRADIQTELRSAIRIAQTPTKGKHFEEVSGV